MASFTLEQGKRVSPTAIAAPALASCAQEMVGAAGSPWGPAATLSPPERVAGTEETNKGLSLLCRQKPSDGGAAQGYLRAKGS